MPVLCSKLAVYHPEILGRNLLLPKYNGFWTQHGFFHIYTRDETKELLANMTTASDGQLGNDAMAAAADQELLGNNPDWIHG